MKIQGLQKLTLLDYPGQVACTVFTAGCNFRCPYCHNASLVTHVDPENDILQETVLEFLQKRKGILDGVCVTGGEPLLQPDVETFIRKIKELGYLVKLDTNGSDMQKMKSLVEQGLVDYVAMDIKNAPNRYGETIGILDYHLESILQSVDYLLTHPVEYEFRTTMVRGFHKREDMEVIGKWLKGASKYFLQSFVDSGDLIHPGLQGFNKEIMTQALEIVRRYVPNAELRGV